MDTESEVESSNSEETSDELDEDSENDPEKKRMRVLYNTLIRFKNTEGIRIIDMFMEKPSRKDYPDYFEVISQPIGKVLCKKLSKLGRKFYFAKSC